ncbi:uncharacterized protein LOC126323932 [Schistocerca gregaria]|uniref:uncharacterized protein LOC126323932 n=1 Tax=Schistocerca gregaria TaxID=7010 RepID=UPI00211E3C0A|nr:uncharacterized protein LOC126323932 [Schistocerca gregaria]XP_049850810.1 uncharacterized protein LOC126323932 [Schistocerca gregaria]
MCSQSSVDEHSGFDNLKREKNCTAAKPSYRAVDRGILAPADNDDRDAQNAGTLVWDPTIAPSEVDDILETCKVKDETVCSPKVLSGFMGDGYNACDVCAFGLKDDGEDDDGFGQPLRQRYEDSNSMLLPLLMRQYGEGTCSENNNIKDDILCLEDMLQVVSDSNYSKADTLAKLQTLGIRGWHPRRPNKRRWSRHEIELFELYFNEYRDDLAKIQTFVKTKSVADCIELYFSGNYCLELERESARQSENNQYISDAVNQDTSRGGGPLQCTGIKRRCKRDTTNTLFSESLWNADLDMCSMYSVPNMSDFYIGSNGQSGSPANPSIFDAQNSLSDSELDLFASPEKKIDTPLSFSTTSNRFYSLFYSDLSSAFALENHNTINPLNVVKRSSLLPDRSSMSSTSQPDSKLGMHFM